MLGATGAQDTLRDTLTHTVKRIFGKGADKETNALELWALKDISFDVNKGEVVGIVGRNGAGKSTLLKVLSQITEPTEGRILMRGRVASLLEVGTGFHPELTGRENIFLNGAILGMKQSEIRQKLDEIIAFAEVEKFLDTPVKRYSSGMYVRLAFSVAAHLEQEILIIDEVLAVGDAAFQAKCMTKMGDVASKEGRTVLFVSHNLAAVQRLCRTGMLIDGGRVRERGAIATVLDTYQRSAEQAGKAMAAGDVELRANQVRFLSWELVDSEETDKHTCHTRDTCHFLVRYAAGGPLSNVLIAFILWDMNGELVLAADSKDLGFSALRAEKGVNQVKITVRLPIKAGMYQIDMGVSSESVELERANLFPRLNVLPSGSSLPEKWQGYLTEEVKFTF
jgi:lipopolysaccharide transport system ATP-binding protein